MNCNAIASFFFFYFGGCLVYVRDLYFTLALKKFSIKKKYQDTKIHVKEEKEKKKEKKLKLKY